MRSSEFVDRLTDSAHNILDTDYFLVALGSDEDNISVANTVRKYVGQHHIAVNDPIKTVITYVVYDPDLSKTLNRKTHFSFVNDSVDVYMRAIGSLNEVYSVRNVFMTEHESDAQATHESYMAIQDRKKRAETHKERLKDDYKHWANRARGMHKKYRAYAWGMIKVSLFDYPNSLEDYSKEIESAYNEYKKVISGQFEFESPDHEREHLALLHRMAWMEHRRWNAFTRVKGFRHTNDYDTGHRRASPKDGPTAKREMTSRKRPLVWSLIPSCPSRKKNTIASPPFRP